MPWKFQNLNNLHTDAFCNVRVFDKASQFIFVKGICSFNIEGGDCKVDVRSGRGRVGNPLVFLLKTPFNSMFVETFIPEVSSLKQAFKNTLC